MLLEYEHQKAVQTVAYSIVNDFGLFSTFTHHANIMVGEGAGSDYERVLTLRQSRQELCCAADELLNIVYKYGSDSVDDDPQVREVLLALRKVWRTLGAIEGAAIVLTFNHRNGTEVYDRSAQILCKVAEAQGEIGAVLNLLEDNYGC